MLLPTITSPIIINKIFNLLLLLLYEMEESPKTIKKNWIKCPAVLKVFRKYPSPLSRHFQSSFNVNPALVHLLIYTLFYCTSRLLLLLYAAVLIFLRYCSAGTRTWWCWKERIMRSRKNLTLMNNIKARQIKDVLSFL